MTCDMFRGSERGLAVATVDGEKPRPNPDVSYARDEALALAVGRGN